MDGKSTEEAISQKFTSRLKQLEGRDGVKRFLKGLKHKKTDNATLIYVHEKLRSVNMLQETYKEDHKSDSATKYKEKGDKFFVTGEYGKALRSYTKSLMRAKEQKLLATLYANRSAALLKLGLYRECLTDIERAFIHEYDENLKPQLVDRRRKVTKLMHASKVVKYHEGVAASSTNKIEVQTCSTGVKVVATETIQIGDIIVIEEPLVSTIGDAYLNHCHECFNLCYNPIPCDMCTQTLYCNQSCKRKAFVSYHKHECPILKSLKKVLANLPSLAIAVKLFFQHGEQVLSTQILRLIEIVEEVSFEMQPDIDLTAAVIYELVKNYTTAFSGPNGEAAERSFQNNIVVLSQMSISQHGRVLELCRDDDGLFIQQDLLARSLYPFYGKFRHSCAPNVFAQHYGVKRVWRVFRTIEKGKELFISFGPHYTHDFTERRQDTLYQQYRFTCTCRACKENWEQIGLNRWSFDSLDSRFMAEMRKKPDVEEAKIKLTEKIQTLKNLEESEPNIELLIQQKIFLYCCDILGNKRLLQ